MRVFRRGVPAVLVILLSVLFLKGSTINVPTGTWQSTANMSVARANAVAVLVPDGRIVIAGGTDATGAPTASAEAFSADGTFSALPAMSVARAQHAAIYTMTGDLLITGGVTSGGGITNSAEVFDSLTNTWHSLSASMVESRSGHTMSQLQNGNVLIAGGENSSGPVAALEIYDIVSGQFSFAGSLATARKGHAAAVLNDGRVLIIGGTTIQSDGTTATLASTEIYDPSTGQVTAGPSLATPRTNATATTLLDGRVLVVGGSYPEGANGAAPELASAEIFDPVSNTFTASASHLTTARTSHLAFLLPNNNNVLIAGGTATQPDGSTSPLASAELYTPWTDTFAPTAPMSTARAAATGSALGNGTYIGLDGMLLIAGGMNVNSAEVYGFATVKTDKADYPPGTTVHITGSGWQPGETVTLTLIESPAVDTHGPYTAVADANGNISNSDFTPDIQDFGIHFVLTALGSSSHLQAQTLFSDAKNITITFAGTGVGTVAVADTTDSSKNTTCSSTPNPCVASVGNNDSGTLTATATSGSIFAGWSAQSSGVTGCSVNTCNFSMGSGGGSAQSVTATFNAIQNVGTVSVGAQTGSLTYGTPGNATYLITVNRKGGGSGAFTANLTVSGLPAGVSGSFSPNAVSFGAGDNTKTSTLTLSTTTSANPTPGTSFTVQAANALTATDSASGNGSLVIGPKTITPTITANNKPYDGNTTATFSCTLSGVLAADTANVSCTGGTATFGDKNVGNGKTVTATGLTLTGSAASKYQLSSATATGTANITPKALTVTGITANNKPYDGTTSATLNTAGAALVGAIGGDIVSLNTAGATGSFATATAGTAKTVTISGLILAGADLGNYSLTQPTATADITPKALTITGITVNNKIYDGATTGTITGTPTWSGVIGTDHINVGGTGVATFSDKNVGTAKTVTISGYTVTGPDAANYTPASPEATLTANITPKALTVTGVTAANKTYDGTTTATLGGTAALSGVVSGDSVTLNTAGVTASFADKNVGTAKPVTVAGYALSGADSGNYTVTQPTGLTANITAKHITGSFTTQDKIYDGTTTAAVLTRSLSGVISPDVVTLTGGTATFSDKNVGTGKTVTLSGATLTGADATNYALDSVSTATASITALHITGTFTTSDKVYDGTTSATVATRSLSGAISGDAVSLTGGTATFSDKNVGNGKAVTLTGATLTGADAGNYVLDSVSTTTANITPKHITGTFTASDKVYDGTTSATVATRSLSGAISGDAVSLTGGSATFSDKNVGVGKTITLTGAALSGTDAGNYVLDSVATATASITALHITGTFTASDKVYDGTTSATVATRSLSGAISGDAVSLTGGSATFSDKNVGNGKTVTLAGASLAGADAGNYILDSVSTTTANITAKHITGSFTAQSRQYDGNNSATVLSRSLTGVIGADVVTLTGGTATFSDKNVGTGKTVTLTGASLTGGDAGNYILDSVATTTADITALHITGSFTTQSKVYDGNTSATVLSRSLSGTLSGDVVSLTGGTATFSDKNVGTGKTVTLTGASLTGTDAGNYVLDSVVTTTADITARDLHVTATGISKVYDGYPTATVTLSDDRVTGDMLTVNYSSASFNNKNVGTGKPISVSGISISGGADQANYHLVNTTASASADITPRALTVSATAMDKVYDGTTSATVTLSDDRVPSDVLSVNYTSATFADKNAGTAKVVTVTGITVTGTDAGNYTFNTTTTTTANITPKSASVTPDPASKIFGNPDPTPLTTGTLSGFLPADGITATYSRQSGETVGTYLISATLTPISALSNYNISYNTATFTIKAWTLTGFYQPVTPYNGVLVWNTIKGGQTVPVKFNIYAGTVEQKTLAAVPAGSITVNYASCNAGLAETVVDVTNSGATSLRYDSVGGQFIQNWQTPKGANQCYVIQMKAADGSSLFAYFMTK